jgi:GTPase
MSTPSRKSRPDPRFVDQARIVVQAGDGGDGALTFRREKFVPRGGPDGGNGGRGGSLYLRAEPTLGTLIDCIIKRQYKAPSGKAGQAKKRFGASGEDIVVRVPVGTMIRRGEDGALLADLQQPGQTFLAAKGGRGGRGNIHFATPTLRTPRFAEKGEPGQSRELLLELRLLADIGIVGLPNAGKSTLIARISAARPKTAPYPFTTLSPNLGVVRLDAETSFIVADMPGLIEGAHKGEGLGHDFLHHIERTRVLVHVVDISLTDRDPLADFATINQELHLHKEWVAKLPQLVVLNKIDLPEAQERLPEIKQRLEAQGRKVYPISAVTGEGVKQLVGAMASGLKTVIPPYKEELIVEETPPAPLEVKKVEEGVFAVSGAEIERYAKMLDPGNDEAMVYLRRRLGQKGVLRRLAALGARYGDKILLADYEMEYRD